MKSRKDQTTTALRKQYLLNLKQHIACLKPNYKPKIPDEFPTADILGQAYELCLKLLNLNILHTLNASTLPAEKTAHLFPKLFFLNSNSVQSNIYRNVIQLPRVYVHNMLSVSQHLAVTCYYGLSMDQKDLSLMCLFFF